VSGASKSVAIVQSSYVPWKGYFDLINSVDEFILYDDRQFTRRDWRNRNRIKTAQGTIWLTIPVRVKGKYTQRIDETEIADPSWADQHWKTVEHAYRGARCFETVRPSLESLYADGDEPRLSGVNRRFIERICELLGISTRLTWSTDYAAEGAKSERLVALCRSAGATRYVSGPTARAYLDERLFAKAGIEVCYADYSGYPEYEQLHPPFEHAVSILDLLVHEGDGAKQFMKSFTSPHALLDVA
jgi:hypothetical protein